MKIKYIKDQELHFFRNNSVPIAQYISIHDDKNWIQNYIGMNPFGITKIDVPELQFVVDRERDPIETDFDNAKMLYEALKHLNETQATDERLWVGIELNEGYEYMLYRWGFDADTKFKYRWTYFTTGKRALLYHGLARLWWFTRLTYDRSREDHYELTRFGFNNQSIMLKLFYRNYSNSPIVVRAILSALKDFDQEYVLTYTHTIELFKEVSLIGSVSLIDAFTEEELKEKIRKIMSQISLKLPTKRREQEAV